MNLADQISNDYLFFDNIVTVSYQSVNADGTYKTAITAVALKRQDDKRLKTGEKQVRVTDHSVPWKIWKASMSDQTIIPKRGDKFTAPVVSGSQTFVVKDADYCTFTTCYRLKCLQSGQGA